MVGYCVNYDCTASMCLPTLYMQNHTTILMQALQPAFKIDEAERKDNLLEVVSDRYCRSIIESTINTPKSAQEISIETKIPISTVYRRIQTLHDNKLLHTSGMISHDGKKFFLYKSKIKGIQTIYDNGTIEVELILNK